MKFITRLLAVLPLALTACTAPLVIPEGPTFQSKVGHAADWESLANRTAGRFAASLDGKTTAVFVAPGPADMPFATAYRKLLEKELIDRHFRVDTAATPSDKGYILDAGATGNPAVLRFNVQCFLYKEDHNKSPVDYATFLTTLAALGSQVHKIASDDTGAAIVAGAGPVADILVSMYDWTQAEVVLTLTVTDGRQIQYRNSETFYVYPSDLKFYLTQTPDFTPRTDISAPAEVSLHIDEKRN